VPEWRATLCCEMAGLAVLFVAIMIVAAFLVRRAPRSSLRFRVGAPVLWLALFAGGLELATGVAGAFASAVDVVCLILAVSLGLAFEPRGLDPRGGAGGGGVGGREPGSGLRLRRLAGRRRIRA
jgi:hypothetical protein